MLLCHSCGRKFVEDTGKPSFHENISTSLIENTISDNIPRIGLDHRAMRPGCKDIWNASMVDKAVFGKYDIPFYPTTATKLPKTQVTWDEAKQLHRAHLAHKEYDYHEEAFVNWYLDDYKFDGIRGIWNNYKSTLEILRHFSGAITPDFSTNQDFPAAIKIYATYRMRAFGYWLGREGIEVINNVRWGTDETSKYCFEGIPSGSVVSIGTVGGGPRKLIDRACFEIGLLKMVLYLRRCIMTMPLS